MHQIQIAAIPKFNMVSLAPNMLSIKTDVMLYRNKVSYNLFVIDFLIGKIRLTVKFPETHAKIQILRKWKA